MGDISREVFYFHQFTPKYASKFENLKNALVVSPFVFSWKKTEASNQKGCHQLSTTTNRYLSPHCRVLYRIIIIVKCYLLNHQQKYSDKLILFIHTVGRWNTMSPHGTECPHFSSIYFSNDKKFYRIFIHSLQV